MRFTEPDRPRGYKVPLNLELSGRELPLPAVLGVVVSLAAWVLTFIYHGDARWLGSAWMALGLAIYAAYRAREGLSLTKRVEVPAEKLVKEREVEYGSILVPVFGEELDDDIMSTAGQLASERRTDEGGAVIEVIYVHEIPVSLPLDARVPNDRFEAAQRALGRAKRVGEEYSGVEVATALVRGRRVGLAIVEEAKRRGVEAIVIGAEPPSLIRGGGLLGGLAGTRPRELGEVTEYVLEKAHCQVVVTAPPTLAKDDDQAPGPNSTLTDRRPGDSV
jgi:APA family basic amino acid/polyamine antiporter